MEQNENNNVQNKPVDEMQEFTDAVNNIKKTETCTLPSKGLLYEPQENISQSITIRRMTTREDKMRMRNESDNLIMRDILQACILDKNVDAGKLKIADANYLLFKLRVISLLDDTYKVACTCPYCQTRFIHQINLSEVPVTYLDEDKVNLMKVQLPFSKNNVDFKMPSLNDMITAGANWDDYFARFPDADKNEYLYTFLSSLYIDKVNGKKLMSLECEDFIDSIDIIDGRAIRDIISKLSNLYGYVETIKAECPSCKKSVEHGLPITSELFTPSK